MSGARNATDTRCVLWEHRPLRPPATQGAYRAQGIGAEIARVFYQRGYKVGIYDINESLAQNLAQELGPNACAGYLDVSDYSQWQHILKEFTDWAGELNILVNNAGATWGAELGKFPEAGWDKVLDTNLKSFQFA